MQLHHASHSICSIKVVLYHVTLSIDSADELVLGIAYRLRNVPQMLMEPHTSYQLQDTSTFAHDDSFYVHRGQVPRS